MQRAGDGLEFSPMAEVLKNVRCIDGIEGTVANPCKVAQVRNDVNVIGGNCVKDLPAGCPDFPTYMEPVRPSNGEQLTYRYHSCDLPSFWTCDDSPKPRVRQTRMDNLGCGLAHRAPTMVGWASLLCRWYLSVWARSMSLHGAGCLIDWPGVDFLNEGRGSG